MMRFNIITFTISLLNFSLRFLLDMIDGNFEQTNGLFDFSDSSSCLLQTDLKLAVVVIPLFLIHHEIHVFEPKGSPAFL